MNVHHAHVSHLGGSWWFWFAGTETGLANPLDARGDELSHGFADTLHEAIAEVTELDESIPADADARTRNGNDWTWGGTP